jgi:hypothetical protein
MPGPQGILLENPTDITVGEDGLIYVVDRKPAHIKVFEPNGKFLRTIGKRGQGPDGTPFVRVYSASWKKAA